jgi:CheY-like chemotaxis protein
MIAPLVLLIEDEQAVLKAVARLLSRLGYAVETAANGREALALLQRGSYAAVLCDLQLPDLSGEQLVATLERERPDLLPRIVFTSGNVSGPAVRRFVELFGCGVLAKPYRLEELRTTLRKATGPRAA